MWARSSLTCLASRGAGGAAVAAEPQVAFGAVFGDGADQQEDFVDEFGAGAHVEQVGQAGAEPGSFARVGQADAGVGDRGGDGPGAGGGVLDDRHPGEVRVRGVGRRGW